ncbi:hypothetical protein SAMN04488065_1373 [Haloplanus vescus]|uniref:DUF7837 domain-containing protein n=1 Tax=Haloplanus vescus TaxID=555874 RepID=A0A1H3X5V9_9EURY|nr:hypothetical protein SAMN04488065_1373 [Haloplanus vescus]
MYLRVLRGSGARCSHTLSFPMPSQSPTLGDCPNCHTDISRHSLLIEYDTTDGPAAYAECPDCRDVVHPT